MTTPTLLPDTIYPPRQASSVQLGYNVPLDDPAKIQVAHDGGASIVRGGAGWNGLEDFFTGALALRPKTKEGFERAASLGLTIMPIAGYSPPHRQAAQVKVAVPAAPGSTVIQVQPSSYPFKYLLDFLSGHGGKQLTPHTAGAGTLIVSMTQTQISLGAPLEAGLAVGDVLNVNRSRIPALVGTDPKQAGAQAYARYCAWLDSTIRQLGAEAVICLMNEWPGQDHWADAADLYDPLLRPAIAKNVFMQALRLAVLELPTAIRWCNGGTDFGPFGGTVKNFPGVDPKRLQGCFDGAHPYSSRTPWHSAWNPDWGLVNPVIDAAPGWAGMAHRDMQVPGFGVCQSECGTLEPSDERHAIYLTQCVMSAWVRGVLPVVYACDPHAGNMSVVREGPEGEVIHRPAFDALASMVEDKRALGDGGAASPPPEVGHATEQTWPVMAGQLVGPNGSITYLCQAPWSAANHGWSAIPSPPPAHVPVSSSGTLRAKVIRTGQPVAVEEGRVAVTDDPVAVLS